MERLLKESGFDVLVVWQCELRDKQTLQQKLIDFLEGGPVV